MSLSRRTAFSKDKYKGPICTIYHGKLAYELLECVHCHKPVVQSLSAGADNRPIVTQWGIRIPNLSRIIKAAVSVQNLPKGLRCRNTNRKKHCFISKRVRWSIVTCLKKNTEMTEIANQKNVSVSSVYRIMKRFYQPTNPFRKQFKKRLWRPYFKDRLNESEIVDWLLRHCP